MMESDFKNLFWKLSESKYEAHWLHTLPYNDVVNGVPSDCSDRAYALGDWCEQHHTPYSFIWTLFLKPKISLHVALLVSNFVYDPIFNAYEYPIKEYKQYLNGLLTIQTGKWIRKMIP